MTIATLLIGVSALAVLIVFVSPWLMRRSCLAYHQMDDRQLDDIGMTRGMIDLPERASKG
jgi:uncharacterized protein YjiS (DUF1127 family)